MEKKVYIRKFRYEVQEQKEVPVWYTGIYRPISSTGYRTVRSWQNFQSVENFPSCYGARLRLGLKRGCRIKSCEQVSKSQRQIVTDVNNNKSGFVAPPASCTMDTGSKARPGRDVNHIPHLVPRSRTSRSCISPSSAFMAFGGTASSSVVRFIYFFGFMWN